MMGRSSAATKVGITGAYLLSGVAALGVFIAKVLGLIVLALPEDATWLFVALGGFWATYCRLQHRR
jgi:hypothetical protein